MFVISRYTSITTGIISMQLEQSATKTSIRPLHYLGAFWHRNINTYGLFLRHIVNCYNMTPSLLAINGKNTDHPII